MKKRYLFFAMLAAIVLVSGCGKKSDAAEETAEQAEMQEATAEEETEASDTEETVVEADDQLDSIKEAIADRKNNKEAKKDKMESEKKSEEPAESKGDDAAESAAPVPGDDKIRECLDSFIDWMGLQYFYSDGRSCDSLTAQVAVPIAAYNATKRYTDLSYTEDGLYMIVDVSTLERSMQDIFGKNFSVSDYNVYDSDRLTKNNDGSVSRKLGDWGTGFPKYEIKEIEEAKNTAGRFRIQVRYFGYDAENSCEMSNIGMDAVITCSSSVDSPYGFVITDISTKKAATGAESAQSGAYTNAQLCDMAKHFYTNEKGTEPSYVEVTDEASDGIVTLTLYETVVDDEATGEAKTTVLAVYKIDKNTGKGKDDNGNKVEFK